MRRKVLLIVCLGLFVQTRQVSAQLFAVIVNKSNPVESMSKDEVSKMFLKRTVQWANGSDVLPVDLPANSATRKVFSETLLGKTAAAVKSYWQQQSFSGRGTPPAIKDNEKAVLEYVQANPGAIGYISPESNYTAYRVKIVDVN